MVDTSWDRPGVDPESFFCAPGGHVAPEEQLPTTSKQIQSYEWRNSQLGMVMQSLSERPALVGRVQLLIALFDSEDRDDLSTVPVILRLNDNGKPEFLSPGRATGSPLRGQGQSPPVCDAGSGGAAQTPHAGAPGFSELRVGTTDVTATYNIIDNGMPEFKSPSLATSPLLTQGGQLTSMSDATSGGAASMPHVEQPEPSGLRFGNPVISPVIHNSQQLLQQLHPSQPLLQQLHPSQPLSTSSLEQPLLQVARVDGVVPDQQLHSLHPPQPLSTSSLEQPLLQVARVDGVVPDQQLHSLHPPQPLSISSLEQPLLHDARVDGVVHDQQLHSLHSSQPLSQQLHHPTTELQPLAVPFRGTAPNAPGAPLLVAWWVSCARSVESRHHVSAAAISFTPTIVSPPSPKPPPKATITARTTAVAMSAHIGEGDVLMPLICTSGQAPVQCPPDKRADVQRLRLRRHRRRQCLRRREARQTTLPYITLFLNRTQVAADSII